LSMNRFWGTCTLSFMLSWPNPSRQMTRDGCTMSCTTSCTTLRTNVHHAVIQNIGIMTQNDTNYTFLEIFRNWIQLAIGKLTISKHFLFAISQLYPSIIYNCWKIRIIVSKNNFIIHQNIFMLIPHYVFNAFTKWQLSLFMFISKRISLFRSQRSSRRNHELNIHPKKQHWNWKQWWQ
jgi:hypothetical protein